MSGDTNQAHETQNFVKNLGIFAGLLVLSKEVLKLEYCALHKSYFQRDQLDMLNKSLNLLGPYPWRILNSSSTII